MNHHTHNPTQGLPGRTVAAPRPHRRRPLLALAAALALLLSAAPAEAAPVHLPEEARDITGLNHACGAAVDSKGDVYLSSAGTGEVKVYDPSHALLTSIADANEPCGLAVTTTGALYVSEKATGEVVRFKPNAYPFAGTPTYGPREVIDSSTKAKGIAVDPVDNRLYAAEGDHIAVYKADGGFEANVGAGTLSEAAGVAAYTYPNGKGNDRYLWAADANGVGTDRLYLFVGLGAEPLKLRRQVTGAATPDGSFGFGTAGAHLAADPGNRIAGKCVAVGGTQACTAGHLFLYDALHEVLDEFDATGEYLDRTANAAFADSEPTAVAIDRSGGAGDGTLYATAGTGAGAKALAFGPLKAPGRETLKEPPGEPPLSHELEGAIAVATDSYGDLYAGAEGEIHVYDPEGNEVVSFPDEHNPTDIAVDSACNVYVLDANGGLSEEAEATYYAPTPSACPPDAGTSYSRKPSITTPADFPAGNSLKAIAVNPCPGPGKDRFFVASNAFTHLYDSAANGSTPLESEFAKSLVPGILHRSIAVSCKGAVYIAINPKLIYAVDEAGKEVLARIETTGSPSGEFGSNPLIAVDQSSGHVLEFDKTHGAREYDAAGSFVAEFGSFTEGLSVLYRIAVDSACATHEPPLDETTTPTCHEFDPANGTAYVAYDDTNPDHPPYDVSAFGPLSYGPEGDPVPHYKLKVTKTGSGTGTVTGGSTAEPSTINCGSGSGCEHEYEEGAVVTLSQSAAAGSEFKGWTGCTSEEAGKCKVTMGAAKSVEAKFDLVPTIHYKLKVTKTGSGTGTVTGGSTAEPSTINCGSGSGCEHEYEEGAVVTLSQSAAAGSEFKGWTGCTSEEAGKCKVTMGAAKSVEAKFDLVPTIHYKLKVTKTGSGTGTVTGGSTAEPSTINCGSGSGCEHEYEEGAVVTLSQSAAAGSEFKGWTGCTSEEAGKCKVTMGAAKSVEAKFDLVPTIHYKLKVTKTGSGTGTVTGGSTAEPSTINCGSGSGCEHEYEEGAVVTLSQSAAAGSEFKGWTGCTSEEAGKCKVTMGAAKSVEAKFDLVPTIHYKLKVTKTGSGTGTVTGGSTAEPSTINCGSGSGCEHEYEEGAVVTLSQSAAAGSEFKGWTGCTSEEAGKCKVTMGAAKSVEAKFDLVPTIHYKLKVTKTGSGTGTVTGGSTAEPSTINCGSGSGCEHEYEEGAVVTLSQSAAAGSEFKGWTGCTSEEAGKCKVTMGAAKSVEAKFDLVPTIHYKLKVTKTGSGTGTVTGGSTAEPSTINCGSGSGCEHEYEEGAVVTLSQSAAAGSEFKGWTGCTSEEAGKCKVTMGAAKSVEAKFDLVPTIHYKLKVTKTGSGTGTVTGGSTAEPSTINCGSGSGCEHEYEEGAVVTLSQSAAAGSEFKGWTGCTSEEAGKCKVTMGAAKSVEAKFDLVPHGEFLLAVSRSGTGVGTVSSRPVGIIDCGETCAAIVDSGTTVTLVAAVPPGSHTQPVVWSGCDSVDSKNKCVVTMSAAKSVTATFNLVQRTLTVTRKGNDNGNGYGTVTSSPAGIKCSGTCNANFDHGTTVILSGTPEAGSQAVVWTGCDSVNGAGGCVVSMTANRTVTATFNPVQHMLTVIKKGNGTGTVTSDPAGIKCGATCSASFEHGFGIRLTAVPAPGSRIKDWSGCGELSVRVCAVVMREATTVSVSFKCRKGFHRKKGKGRIRCVKARGHGAHGRSHRNNNSSASWIAGWLGRAF